MPNFKSKAVPMVGKTYGLLRVEKFAWIDQNRHACYFVRCACGSPSFPVQGYRLRQGRTKSCGCYRAERARILKPAILGDGWEPKIGDDLISALKDQHAKQKLEGFKVTIKD